ncbi:DUF3341 domain-containing protein [bacterium]|nr:DUF3341 domain-containing protein [bacterium]
MATKEKGILAVFNDQHQLLDAIKKVRAMGITKMDAFTPFPIHGIEDAMGLKRSWIPWATLVYGLTGATLAFTFETWTSAFDWPLNIGGKPFISWPAFIPITFEGGILIGGVLTVLTLFGVMKLPCFSKPVLDVRLTNDHFGLMIEDADPKFNEDKLSNAFKECHVVDIKKIGH